MDTLRDRQKLEELCQPSKFVEGMEMISRPSLNRNFAWQRVLLTGHTGFKELARLATELGAEVTGVSLNPNNEQKLFEQLNLKQRLAKHYIKDIRDEIALKAMENI